MRNSFTSTAAIYSVIRLGEWNIIQTPQLTFKRQITEVVFCPGRLWELWFIRFLQSNSFKLITSDEALKSLSCVGLFSRILACARMPSVFCRLSFSLGVRVRTRAGTIFKFWAEKYFWQVDSSRGNQAGGTAYFTINCSSSTI